MDESPDPEPEAIAPALKLRREGLNRTPHRLAVDADQPDSTLIGRCIAQRFRIQWGSNDGGYFWYFGVVTHLEIPDGDPDREPDPEPWRLCGVFEDGSGFAFAATDFGDASDPGAAGLGDPLLCPCGPSGRPIRVSRVSGNAVRTPHGLMIAYGREEGETRPRLVTGAGLHCDEARAEATQLERGTAAERSVSSSFADKHWRWEELPASVWPIDPGSADGISREFETLWRWLRNPQDPASPAPASAAAGHTPPAAPTRPVGVPAPPPGHRPIRRAPEADDSGVPAERRAAFQLLLDDLDPSLRDGFQPADRDCSLAGMRLLLYKSRAGGSYAAKEYRPKRNFFRGPELSAGGLLDLEQDQAIADICAMLRSGKASTMRKHRSVLEQYRQASESRFPPRPMFPLTCENVSHWWCRCYLKNQSMNRLSDDLSIVQNAAWRAGFDDNGRTPGIDPLERRDLKVVERALLEMDASGVRRAFPLTLRLFQFIRGGQDVDTSSLADPQFWARIYVAHGAMLRSQDHCKGRPRWGDWIEKPAVRRGFAFRATFMVRPGKAHSRPMPAEFGTLTGGDHAASRASACAAGLMAEYRRRLREQYRASFPGHAEPPADAYLFPELDSAGNPNWSRYMDDTAFLRSLRDRGRACGMPAALCKRFQFHGFRSGGASDWFNYGHQTHAIIEFIQRQGRWNSTAFRIYIRLRGDTIASVMDEVFAAAGADEEHTPVQSAGARRTPIVRSDQMFAALRADHRASMAAQRHLLNLRPGSSQ